MLLLYLMAALCPKRIRAIYINHQLQSANAQWADFVATHCQRLHIPYVIESVNVATGNLEQQARNARYQAFQQHLDSNEILLLAHHQQDQAETVMLRLLSGAGVQGLSAMKVLDQRENLTLWRPLLHLSREHICQWVAQSQIEYVDDPTNLDTHYDRAWCREQLWHILQSRFPKMQTSLARTSLLMQDANQILAEVLVEDLARCVQGDCLDLTAFQQLSMPRQRQLLSHWVKGDALYRPSFELIQRIFDQVIGAKVDAQAALQCNGDYYLRYQDHLYRVSQQDYQAAQRPPETAVTTLQVQLQAQLQLASGTFDIATAEMGLRFDLLGQVLCLYYRQGGERVHLYGRVGSWPLKKAIQAAEIFPWMRHTIQILSIDNVMLGVFTPKGFWLAQSDYCEVGGWQPHLSSL